MGFTVEQEIAINEKNKNILVSAAAGSGKTSVLTERIIKKIIYDKININELLVVTFTEMSALEMKERIEKRLNEEITKTNDRYLLKQKNLLSSSNISTIHSFCSKLIKNNFNLCDTDPNFKILDTKESDMLKESVLTEIFNEKYENDDTFLELIEIYGDKIIDNTLKEIILKIYENAMSNPYPEEWLKSSLKNYDVTSENLNDNVFINYIRNYTIEVLHNSLKKIEILKNICNESMGLDKYLNMLDLDEDLIKKNYDSLLKNNFFDIIFSFDFSRMPTLGKIEFDKGAKEIVSNLRNEYKSEINSLSKNFYSKSQELFFEETSNQKKYLSKIIKLTLEFKDKFTEEKKKVSALDYNDLEQLALNLLTENNSGEIIPTNIAKELQSYYKEILIDEYQDCNNMQEAIFNSISNGKNLFLVGDVKQSIYGFRHSSPELFLHKYNTYNNLDNTKIILSRNFRSSRNIISSTNFIFSQIMNEDLGGIAYNKEASLVKGLKKFTKKSFRLRKGIIFKKIIFNSKINLLIGEFDKKKFKDNKISKHKFEGNIISNKIYEIIEGKNFIFDNKEKKYRRVEYRDIAILSRSKTHINDVCNALKDKKIPFTNSTKGNFFDSFEIYTIVNYLQILDNQLQDIPLIATLKSPIYSIFSTELIEIKNTKNADNNFFNKMFEFAKNSDSQTAFKLNKFFNDFNILKEKSNFLTISELIENILNITQLKNYIKTLPNFEIRLANIKTLITLAKEYENTNFSTLFNFSNYVFQLKTNNVLINDALVNSDSDNAVKILTIHSSKGLEFPIVFLCNLNNNFNVQDEKEKIIISNKLGLSSDNINLEYRIKTTTYQKEISKILKRKDLIAEELRMLYVAMTRAESQLYLCAITEDINKDTENCTNILFEKNIKINSSEILNCKSHYELLLKAFIRHRDWDFLDKNVILNDIYNFNLNLNIELFDETFDTNNITKKVDSNSPLLERVKNCTKQNLSETFEKLNNFKYPYEKNITIKNKIMISDLKRKSTLLEEENLNISKPNFIFNTKTETNLGVTYHKIIENLDLSLHKNEKDLETLIHELTRKNLINIDDLEGLNFEYILNFINSDLANRMKKSDRVVKEKIFTISLTKDDNYNLDLSDDSYMLLNGIIDCYFIEDEEVVIVDFKSDNIYDIEEFKKRYSLQLNVYKLAIEKSTNYKVKEMLIYSLKKNEIIEIH